MREWFEVITRYNTTTYRQEFVILNGDRAEAERKAREQFESEKHCTSVALHYRALDILDERKS